MNMIVRNFLVVALALSGAAMGKAQIKPINRIVRPITSVMERAFKGQTFFWQIGQHTEKTQYDGSMNVRMTYSNMMTNIYGMIPGGDAMPQFFTLPGGQLNVAASIHYTNNLIREGVFNKDGSIKPNTSLKAHIEGTQTRIMMDVPLQIEGVKQDGSVAYFGSVNLANLPPDLYTIEFRGTFPGARKYNKLDIPLITWLLPNATTIASTEGQGIQKGIDFATTVWDRAPILTPQDFKRIPARVRQLLGATHTGISELSADGEISVGGGVVSFVGEDECDPVQANTNGQSANGERTGGKKTSDGDVAGSFDIDKPKGSCPVKVGDWKRVRDGVEVPAWKVTAVSDIQIVVIFEEGRSKPRNLKKGQFVTVCKDDGAVGYLITSGTCNADGLFTPSGAAVRYTVEGKEVK